MSFHCFSLHFTCRAREWKCIPIWVTHTSTELSTEGQIPRINSSLAWTYTKKLSTFSLLQQSSTGPAWPERLCNHLHLEVFQDPSEQSPVQPILTSELTMLEAEGSTRHLLISQGTYVFLWICYLGPALLFKLPPIMKLKKGGKVVLDHCPWNQFRLQNLRDGEMILVHLLLLLTPSLLEGRRVIQ